MKNINNQILKTVFIFTLVVMTTSCSFKTIYNQLDSIIPDYVEGMVSLDGILEEKVEQRSAVLLKWHRNTQLKQYSSWLRLLQKDTNDKLTENKIHGYISKLEGFWKSIILKIDDEMVLLLPLLNAAQREELFSNVTEKNDEFRKDYTEITKEKRISRYAERIIDNFEKWLGSLTDAQKKLVKQTSEKLQTTASKRLERRKHWQNSIKRILDGDDSLDKKRASLREFFAKFKINNDQKMIQLVDYNKDIIASLTLQVVHSMTAEQKTHFLDSTNDYIRMFDELVKER